MDKALQQFRDRLASHGEDLQAVVDDERLNALLQPYREDWPRLLRCPKPGCRGKLVWIAIDPYSPRVVGKQVGPSTDKVLAKNRRDHELPPARQDEELPRLYEHWSVQFGSRTIGETVDTHLDENHRWQWIITCRKPKCRARYHVTNTELLVLLAAAHLRGPGYIPLPAGCELPPS